MANDGVISGKDILKDDVFDRIDAFNKGIEESIKLYNQLAASVMKANSAAGGNKILSERVKIDKENNIALKERNRLLNAVQVAEERRRQATSELAKNLAKERFETQKINRENKQAAILTSKYADAYDKLAVKLAIAKRNLKNLTIEQGEGAEATKKARLEFERLNTQVRNADQSAGDFQRNVGNYPTKFAPALNAIRSLVGAFGLIEGIRLGASIVKDAILLSREAKGVTFAFKQLGAVGVDALERTRESTRGLLSDLDIKKAANEFQNFNLSVSELPTLLEFVAVRASQTGKSFEGLRDSLVEGLAKESTLRIDNLGISVKDLNAELKQTGNFAQAVANIAKREIKEAGNIIDETANATQRWEVATQNTLLAVGDVFTQVKGSNFVLNLIENYAQGWKNLNFAIENNLSLYESIKLNYRNFTEEGRKVNKTLIEETEARKKLGQELRRQADDYARLNGSIAPLLNPAKETPFSLFKEEDKRLLLDINAELDKYNLKLTEGAFSTRAEAKAIQDKIAELEKEKEAILGSNRASDERKRKLIELVDVIANEGTMATDLVKDLADVFRDTWEIPERQEEIKELFKSLQDLGLFKDFKLGEVSIAAPDTDKINDALQTYQKIKKQTEDANVQVTRISAEKQQEIFDQLFSTFGEYYNLDLTAFSKMIGGKEVSMEDYANFAKSISGAILDSSLIRYENELRANEEKLQAILNDETSTEKQKAAAQKKATEEQNKIREKQAKAERRNVLIQIGIDTAAAVAKVLAQTGVVAPFVIPGIIALGLAQAAFVASQPLPQFFKGKNAADNFEGVGTWGEKRREVNVDSNGNIEVSPNRTTPRYIKKSDIIVPSIPQFQKELKDPSSDVFKRVSRKMGQDTVERNNMIMVSSPAVDTKGIEEVIYKALSQRQAIKNNVNVTVQAPRRTSY